MSKKRLCVILLSILITIIVIAILIVVMKEEPQTISVIGGSNETETNTNFDFKIIKKTINETNNYLVSPFSIAYAFSMLKEGAAGETREELDSLGKRKNI